MGNVDPVFGGGDLLVQLLSGRDAKIRTDPDIGEGDAIFQGTHTDRTQILRIFRGKGSRMQVDAVEIQLAGTIDKTLEIEGAGGEFIFVAEGHAAKLAHGGWLSRSQK